MCGRYVSATPADQLAEEFHVDAIKADDLPAKYNVAPTDPIYAVAPSRDGETRQLGTFKWGLVPNWSKDATGGARMINARAETLTTKPAFRRLLELRRCLIPADGFYEWQRLGEPGEKKPRKQPFFIRRADGTSMAFAGLWDVWKPRDDPDAEWLRSATIITGEPNELIARLHDRMPVILPEESWDEWLDPATTDTDALRALLVPLPADQVEAWPVEPLVNSVQNDGPELVVPLEGHDPL
ncbi:MAG TPA: SOS response-associated peptidase [Acidimicrobiales bacterium]|nr:SOS response-associated peptidase [Acidimicrobiales bacterium]